MRRSQEMFSGVRPRLWGAAMVIVAVLALPSTAMAFSWPTEQAMKDEPSAEARGTFVYDPGQHKSISRAAFVQAPLKGYYEGRGFDTNFLTWAGVDKLNLGAAPWAGCTAGPHSGPCPTGSLHFNPVNLGVTSGEVTVLHAGSAFIATVCGNFSEGGGNGPMPRITGVKYDDLNGDGKRQTGEPGLSGWTIRLRYEGKSVATTTTAGNGAYSFKLNANKLPIGQGKYRVEEVLKPGWVASQTPGSIDVPLGARNTTYSGRDFGNYRPAKIAGSKIDDSNVNGERDPLEVGLGNWEISLSNGESQLTSEAGDFSFSVRPGTYTVGETLQEGWRQTFPGEGTRTYTVISGDVIEDADFGNVCLGDVSILPVDKSTGEPVPMEVRLEEVAVPGILDNEPGLPRTATGTPSFEELLPGTYRMIAFLPEGVFTTDPDAVPVEGRFAIVKEISVKECETTEVPLKLFTESSLGKITGGVKVDLPDGFATSGFEFMSQKEGLRGTLQYNDHVADLTLHTSMIEAIRIKKNGEAAVVWGKVSVDGDLQRFRLRLVDAGEPGVADRYELTLSGGYEAGAGVTLSGGNIQIH